MNLKAISVKELNSYMGRLLGNDPLLGNIRVRGEISNFKIHYGGNVYLTLKDEDAKVSCVIFKKFFDRSLELEDGMKVTASGRIGVFERDGKYQLYIKNIELEGEGALFLKFNQLKDRLEKEGLFDSSHKKKIPEFPKAIGVVTSETGAVIRDIINVVKRRYPKVEIKLFPASVQGPNSSKDIVEGIEYFNRKNNVDTLIIGRGGGSMEELWSFNEENVAYAIFNSKLPVISAVGHETDFTISDMVADLRAPTPSAAAELATPSLAQLKIDLLTNGSRLRKYIESLADISRMELKRKMEKINFIVEQTVLKDNSIMLDSMLNSLNEAVKNAVRDKKQHLKYNGAKLSTLNPLATLERGFSVVSREDKIIESISDIEVGQNVNIEMKDGILDCKVESMKGRVLNGEENDL